MSEKSLWEHQRALDRHAKKVLERAVADEEFMQATREGVEAHLRGEKGVPFREIREEARRRQAEE